jgi:hypothetical protein
MHDRHHHLLAADAVDLLADHLLDALGDPKAQGQQGVDPRAELTNVAGAQQQLRRSHLDIGRRIAQRHEEEAAQAHGALILAAGLRRAALTRANRSHPSVGDRCVRGETPCVRSTHRTHT